MISDDKKEDFAYYNFAIDITTAFIDILTMFYIFFCIISILVPDLCWHINYAGVRAWGVLYVSTNPGLLFRVLFLGPHL